MTMKTTTTTKRKRTMKMRMRMRTTKWKRATKGNNTRNARHGEIGGPT